MPQLAPHIIYTYSEYSHWEQQQSQRHEYIRGEIFAMAGTSDRHNEISMNFTSLLRQHLRGTPCRTYMADIKVRVEAADCGFYPDILVTCAQSDLADRYVKRDPLLVIEVLSDSTAAYDIGDKFADYQKLEHLQEYVLVDQSRIRVQVYRYQNTQWHVNNIGPSERLQLASIELDCPIGMLYEDLSEPI